MDRDKKSPHSGHRKRVRKRFDLTGGKGLQDYEALELLLTFAIPRVDTKPIARALLKTFRGLPGVIGATQAELEQVPGIGPKSALLITLVRELASASLRAGLGRMDALKSPQAVVDYARMSLAGRSTELCLLLLVNARNHVTGEETVSEGTVDRANVIPRRVVELALERKASGIILIHNHPSGSPKPSPEDDLLTRRIKSAASTVDLRFLDHLIISTEGWFSYSREGLL